MKTTLILLSSMSMLIDPVIAENVAQFSHGCGTGCTVRVSLSAVVTLRNGVKKGTFLRKFTGGGRGDFNGTLTSTIFAKCSEGLISGNNSNWKIINLSDSNRYTTVQGGIGYYFDAICQSTQSFSIPRAFQAAECFGSSYGSTQFFTTIATIYDLINEKDIA